MLSWVRASVCQPGEMGEFKEELGGMEAATFGFVHVANFGRC